MPTHTGRVMSQSHHLATFDRADSLGGTRGEPGVACRASNSVDHAESWWVRTCYESNRTQGELFASLPSSAPRAGQTGKRHARRAASSEGDAVPAD
jgi:hypothetical protein